MEHDKAASYHPVKSIQRFREKNPMGGHAGAEDHGKVIKTEVERHPSGPGATVRAHHADGHIAEHQHPDEATAHDHAKDLMSGGDSMQSNGQVDTATDSECPHCGAQMVDGECPQCGYQDKPGGAQPNDHDEDDGY
jgi:hypothetical protein